MRRKKLITMALATVMLVSQGMSVMAADSNSGSLAGSGSNEGEVPAYPVGTITLPTAAAGTFDYIVDPNNLIATIAENASQTGATGHYSDAVFETNNTLFFNNGVDSTDRKTHYSGKSNKLEVINGGGHDIEVTIKAAATDPTYSGGVAFSETSTFESNDKAKKVYIAVQGDKYEVKSDGTLGSAQAQTAAAIKGLAATAAAEMKIELPGNKDNYYLNYKTGTGYEQKAKTGSQLVWAKAAFNLVGTCNTAAEWKSETLPGITVTWSWVDKTAAAAVTTPTIATTSYTFKKGTALEIPVSLGTGDTAATGVTSLETGSSADSVKASSSVTYANGKVTIASSTWASVAAGQKRYLKVTFNDTANTEVVVELTISE